MPITLEEMQRQLHAYAMDEMQNRGIEKAARFLEQSAHKAQYQKLGHDRYHMDRLVHEVRALKTDPGRHLTDWWADEAKTA